jgi:hypothetical protein
MGARLDEAFALELLERDRRTGFYRFRGARGNAPPGEEKARHAGTAAGLEGALDERTRRNSTAERDAYRRFLVEARRHGWLRRHYVDAKLAELEREGAI